MSAFGFLGSLVGGVTGLVGTSMTNKTNWNNQQMANKMSLQISRENNEFNAKEAQKARDWMSYANQRKLMEDAGLNPALMFSDGNLSASSASASSAGIPSFGAAVAQNPFQGFNFADIAAGLKSLAEAKKIGGVDTQKAEAEINNIITTTEGQRIANSYQGRLNDMELKKGAAFVDKTFKEADNLVKQGKLIEAEEALKRAQEASQQEVKRLTGAQADYQSQLASLAFDSIMSDINLKKSQSGLNNMQTAVLPRQVAAQEKQAVASMIGANAAMIGANASKYMAEHPQTWDGALTRVINGFFGGKTFEEIGMEIRSWFTDKNVPSSIVDEFINSIGKQYQKMASSFNTYVQRGKDNDQRNKMRNNGRKVGSTFTYRW